MAYVVVLNPHIIGTAKDMNGLYAGGTDNMVKAITMVTAATALVAGLMTLLLGAIGWFPLAVAAGLGLNGCVAFTLAPRMTWADAMGLGVGIGLFITIIGLVVRKVTGAILLGIVATTVLAIVIEAIAGIGGRSTTNEDGWGLNVPVLPESVLAVPDLGLLGQFSLFGSFEVIGVLTSLLAIFSLMLSDFFDTMGTAFGLATEADLIDDGEGSPTSRASSLSTR